jgi:hypothetical protein
MVLLALPLASSPQRILLLWLRFIKALAWMIRNPAQNTVFTVLGVNRKCETKFQTVPLPQFFKEPTAMPQG